MAKRITRIVLTGGPAAGKTTLISRILKEFKQDDGWKVITIPETATDLISGFGIRYTRSASRSRPRRWCRRKTSL